MDSERNTRSKEKESDLKVHFPFSLRRFLIHADCYYCYVVICRACACACRPISLHWYAADMHRRECEERVMAGVQGDFLACNNHACTFRFTLYPPALLLVGVLPPVQLVQLPHTCLIPVFTPMGFLFLDITLNNNALYACMYSLRCYCDGILTGPGIKQSGSIRPLC